MLQFARQFCDVNAVVFYLDYVLQFAGMNDSHSIGREISSTGHHAICLFHVVVVWILLLWRLQDLVPCYLDYSGRNLSLFRFLAQ
ncbi:hypothetical protein Gasu2_37800 [Galdieria sulphuraria]|nr:hypothetical protein Gasu2_37800 [Galdieria sulphuraria]